MRADEKRSIAATEAGLHCPNAAGDVSFPENAERASQGSTCTNGTSSAPRVPARQITPELQLLALEVDAFVREMRAQRLRLDPSDLSPAQFARILNRTVGKRLPVAVAALLEDIERNLAESSFKDFADPEVLRGMALLSYYSLQAQAEPYRDPLAERLRRVPGYAFYSELRQNLGDARIQDFTQPRTWSIVYATASTTARLKLIEWLREYDEKHDASAAPPVS